ncbi:hypothetical protein [Sandaracinus amylolyticus]|nr:hypothetical protein [Sandaracinus amylolyticus]
MDPVDAREQPEGSWWWTFEFRSRDDDVPLGPGTYLDAQRAPFREPGHPGMSIGGTGRGCNTLGGSFTILDIELDGAVLRRLRARYEQYCDRGEPRLVGCIRYEPR